MKAEFLLSVADVRKLPPLDNPEIAFAGRSNVGKSSMINRVINRKNLVKTGNTPGKTRLLNFFNIDDVLTFVDLPGYGYAAVSKKERAAWGKMIENYLKNRANLRMCFVLIDVRRSIGEEEAELINFLALYGVEPVIVLTKADKLSNNELMNALHRHAKEIGVNVEKLIHFSITNGRGVKEVQSKISEVVQLNW